MGWLPRHSLSDTDRRLRQLPTHNGDAQDRSTLSFVCVWPRGPQRKTLGPPLNSIGVLTLVVLTRLCAAIAFTRWSIPARIRGLMPVRGVFDVDGAMGVCYRMEFDGTDGSPEASSGKASHGTRWRHSACSVVSCRGPSASSMSVRTRARTRSP